MRKGVAGLTVLVGVLMCKRGDTGREPRGVVTWGVYACGGEVMVGEQ